MKRTAFALACALFALAPPAARASTPLSEAAQELGVDDLLERAKVASGIEHRPEAERESWTIRASGLEGTLEISRRGEDKRSDTTLGPFHTARGVVRGQHWHQNDNGETILDKPEASQVERVLSQTIARTHQPVEGWELTTIYASGHLTRNYYDMRYLLVRTDRTIAGQASHTVYEDFRTDASGRTRPWHYFGGDDRAENDYDYRLVRDDLTPAFADELEIPHDRHTLVEFPPGTEMVRLPARIIGNRIYVRLVIAGRGLDFLLDTGSSIMTIDQTVAHELALPLYGRATETVAGSFTTGRVVAPSIIIGPLTMHDVVMRTVPFSAQETPGVRVVGLLGFDFVDALGLRIDYDNGSVDAARPGELPIPATATPLEVALNSGAPVAHATIGDAGGDDFVIDTGTSFSYVLFQRFTRTHPGAVKASIDARSHFMNGIGGSIPYRPVSTSKRIALGTWSLDDPGGIEALSPNAFGFDNEDGLIGADILRRFTVYTDYAESKLYLAPSGRWPTTAGTAPSRATGLVAHRL